MHKTAVVILNYNGKNHLERFLPSVINNSQDCDIIIADNCSTDDSVAYIKNNFPLLKLIHIPRNEGFSKGYNIALSQVKAEFYILLNSDVEVSEGWIQPIIDLLENNSEIAACQPKILSYLDKTHFEYAGAGGGFIDILGYPFCRGRIFEKIEEDKGQYNDVKQVFWASGACLFIKAEVFHEIGGFDDYFFAHMEEIDLCWRINHAGYKIFYNGNSTVYHLGGGTLSKENPKKTFLNFRNNLLMLLKNSSSKELIWKIPIRILLDFIAALKFLLFDTKEDFVALLKAYGEFYKQYWKYNSIRKKIPKIIKNQDLKIIYPGIIVFDYYIRNKKKYKNLNFRI
jgi:GT2 family glycosyltransferase